MKTMIVTALSLVLAASPVMAASDYSKCGLVLKKHPTENCYGITTVEDRENMIIFPVGDGTVWLLLTGEGCSKVVLKSRDNIGRLSKPLIGKISCINNVFHFSTGNNNFGKRAIARYELGRIIFLDY